MTFPGPLILELFTGSRFHHQCPNKTLHLQGVTWDLARIGTTFEFSDHNVHTSKKRGSVGRVFRQYAIGTSGFINFNPRLILIPHVLRQPKILSIISVLIFEIKTNFKVIYLSDLSSSNRMKLELMFKKRFPS